MRHCLLFFSIFLLLTSCSKEEIPDISAEDFNAQEGAESSTDFYKTNELLTKNFLPTFTSFYGRDRGTTTNRSSSLASEWIHEYDENQKLVKSFFFELYPYRLLKEVTYLEIVEDHKLIYEIKEYSYYSVMNSGTDTYELIFDENLNITKINNDKVLIEVSEEGWVLKIHTVAPNDKVVYQTGYEYDQKGNILKYISFNQAGTRSSTVDYTYNENGDPLSYHFQNIYGAEIKVNYFYRVDNTLERLEENYFNDDDDFGTKIFTYSPEERFSTKIIHRGDGSKEMATYSDQEIIVECYTDEVLKEVFVYQVHDGGYSPKLHKEYLNGVLSSIKYYGTDGEVEYTEYYDENGNLTETVYH